MFCFFTLIITWNHHHWCNFKIDLYIKQSEAQNLKDLVIEIISFGTTFVPKKPRLTDWEYLPKKCIDLRRKCCVNRLMSLGVFKGVILPPKRTFSNIWRHFWFFITWGGLVDCYWHLVVETQDATKHPVTQRIAPHNSCCSVAQLRLTLCDPHELQHARLPCPSLSPRICSNSCPSSW